MYVRKVAGYRTGRGKGKGTGKEGERGVCKEDSGVLKRKGEG